MTLPIFICAVLAVTFLIKITYVHEMVQYAINSAACEMAESSYIYYLSGIQGVHDQVRDEVSGRAQVFKEHASSVFDAFDWFTEDDNSSAQSDDGTGRTGKKTGKAGGLTDTISEIGRDPLEELKNIACLLAGGAFDDVKTELCIPVAKLYMRKYLDCSGSGDIGKRLERLSIVNGLEGMDFSDSSFFEDRENDIDIVVNYKLDIPLPFKILPELSITQRASAKAWLGGDDPVQEPDGKTGESVWMMSNFKRGEVIRTRFGANLPAKFPVIARFEDGSAMMIKSMDLTAEYYRSPLNVEDKLNDYISRLAAFKGARLGEVRIDEGGIKERRLKLIVPENEIKPEIQNILDLCSARALSKGIRLEVIRYQRKEDTHF